MLKYNEPLSKKYNYIYFKGICEGNLSFPPKGNKGFAYDKIFVPKFLASPNNEPNQKTFAELDTIEKNQISHRGIALKKLCNFLLEVLPLIK
ncbi:putative Maf/Ham1 family C-terminal domain protein [Candidatus Hepatincolaceae symbiont of Richtersius coronifer]